MNLIIGRKLYTADSTSNEHAPMEVDALKGWKSKGKSKGKDDGGKDEGTGKQDHKGEGTTSGVECYKCGKMDTRRRTVGQNQDRSQS